jgi:hypothetical protein
VATPKQEAGRFGNRSFARLDRRRTAFEQVGHGFENLLVVTDKDKKGLVNQRRAGRSSSIGHAADIGTTIGTRLEQSFHLPVTGQNASVQRRHTEGEPGVEKDILVVNALYQRSVRFERWLGRRAVVTSIVVVVVIVVMTV